jgi:hypothetical protein
LARPDGDGQPVAEVPQQLHQDVVDASRLADAMHEHPV